MRNLRLRRNKKHVSDWAQTQNPWLLHWATSICNLLSLLTRMTIVVSFSCSVMSDSLRPPDHRMPGFPDLHYLLEFAQTHVHRVSDAIQSSHPLSLPSPAINLSQHQGLSSHESVLYIRWPKYWSFSFSISPSNEYSELISFRIDWFDLLAVQGTMVTS